LLSVINTHANQISHFFEFLPVFLGDIAYCSLLISLVYELNYAVRKIAVFAENRADHKILGVCGGRLVIDLGDEVGLFVGTV